MSNICSNYPQRNTMTLLGEGKITAEPDIATIRLGVQTTGENLTITQSENAQLSQSILQALYDFGISDIKTHQYTIEKQYVYENGTRIDKGYMVRNIIEFKMDNMNQIGMVIDTAVYHGANVVEAISFEVSDSNLYYQQALNLAVANAIQKARSISKNFGLVKDPLPIRIVENSSSPIPYSQFNTLREGRTTTPIEPGNIQIDASVTVDFFY